MSINAFFGSRRPPSSVVVLEEAWCYSGELAFHTTMSNVEGLPSRDFFNAIKGAFTGISGVFLITGVYTYRV
jgi:hypothetical protein